MANDVWGWTDEEYGDEYVIIGLSGGTSFVRITDPLKPVVLGILFSRYLLFVLVDKSDRDFSQLVVSNKQSWYSLVI